MTTGFYHPYASCIAQSHMSIVCDCLSHISQAIYMRNTHITIGYYCSPRFFKIYYTITSVCQRMTAFLNGSILKCLLVGNITGIRFFQNLVFVILVDDIVLMMIIHCTHCIGHLISFPMIGYNFLCGKY